MGSLFELGPVCHGTRPQYVSWLINFLDNHQIIGAIFKKMYSLNSALTIYLLVYYIPLQ